MGEHQQHRHLVIMTNGDTYHLNKTSAKAIEDLLHEPRYDEHTFTFIDEKTNDRVRVALSKVSSVVQTQNGGRRG